MWNFITAQNHTAKQQGVYAIEHQSIITMIWGYGIFTNLWLDYNTND